MNYLSKCLLCNNTIENSLFYHPDCFTRRPNRLGDDPSNLKTIAKFIADYHSEKSKTKPHLFKRPIGFPNNGLYLKYTPHYCKSRNGTFSEDELIQLSDFDLLDIKHRLNWYQISANYKFNHPQHFWKIAPFFYWEAFLRSYNKHKDMEAIILRYYKLFDLNQIDPMDMTPRLLYKFRNELDWSKYSSSPAFDEKLLKVLLRKGISSFDWKKIFNRFRFSDYMLKKYLKISGWTFMDLYAYTSHPIPQKEIESNFLTYLKTNARRLLRDYQLPSTLLDQHTGLLDWDYVKWYQKKMDAWLIHKHYLNLVDIKEEKKETVKSFISTKTDLPFIYFANNQYFVDLYTPPTPILKPLATKHFLPDLNELKNHRLVYHLPSAVGNRKKKGLVFYKSKNIHLMTNPWIHYPNTVRKIVRAERNSLRSVLNKNGLGRRERRSIAFNQFLKANKLL
jgi:hypothetical protein